MKIDMRAAIIGCGSIAQVHKNVLEQMEGVEIVAFCDIVPQRAKDMASGGEASYSDFRQMLEQADFNVLHICTPHHLHTAEAIAAVKKGKAVFMEKPPVINREQWNQLRAISADATVGICFQNRYNPETRALMEVLSRPEAGAVKGGRAFVTWRRSPAYYAESEWRGSQESAGGGVLINQAIHTLDLLIRCVGRPDRIEASIANHHLKGAAQVEDTVEAYLRKGDIASVFYASNGYCADSPILLEIVCDHVTARIEGGILTCTWKNGQVEITDTGRKAVTIGKGYWGSGHAACITDFYDSIRQKRPYLNDIQSVTGTVETMLGIYQSAQEACGINSK